MAQTIFLHVIEIFASLAWQALGKVPVPGRDTPEVSGAAAREAIDILKTLQEKTRGNLTPEEARFLEQTIADLQINYVDVMSRTAKEPDTHEHPA